MKYRMAVLLVVAAVGLYPLLFAGMFAGDAVIHLIYARNAAAGHLFEFNLGEVAAGVTSPGYMLVVTLLYKCMPEWLVPLAVKLLNLLAWYCSLVLLYLLALRLVGSRAWALAALAVAGLLPGSAYNANVGMENGVFAAVVLLWFYLADRWLWWRAAEGDRFGRESLLGVVAGLACWLRPEGLIFAPLMVALRAWSAGRERSLVSRIRCLGGGSAVLLVSWAVLAVGLIAFHRVYTGQWVPSSVAARIIQGHRDAFSVGPLPITWKFFERLGAYFPLTLAWLVGSWVLVTSRDKGESRGTARAAMVMSWIFFVLYSTVLGAAHLGRYAIFVMFLMILVAVVGGHHMWTRSPATVARIIPRWAAFGLAGMALATVFAAETWIRRDLGSHEAVAQIMDAPRLRHASSEHMFRALGRPAERPIVVGYQEVQSLYWLDERFVVRALDGRVDGALLNYVHDGYVDHVAYIKARGIRFLAELPNYNRDPGAWGLDRLESLRPGESTVREGLRFTKLTSGLVRVDDAGPARGSGQ